MTADHAEKLAERFSYKASSMRRLDGQPLYFAVLDDESGRIAECPEEEYARIIVDALDRFSKAAAQDGWRTMDSAPKDGTKFDVWQNGERTVEVYWSDVQDAWCVDGEYSPEEPTPLAARPEPTHWRPLPPPPQGSER